jgi:hypothetical protein
MGAGMTPGPGETVTNNTTAAGRWGFPVVRLAPEAIIRVEYFDPGSGWTIGSDYSSMWDYSSDQDSSDSDFSGRRQPPADARLPTPLPSASASPSTT